MSYRCKAWWVPGMGNQSSRLGLDLFRISPGRAFFPPTFAYQYEATHRLVCDVPKVSEKPTECWVWEQCLTLLFCCWGKIWTDLGSTFCLALKHQGLGLLDPLLLLNICLILKVIFFHLWLFSRLGLSQSTCLTMNICEFTLHIALDLDLAALEML